MKVMWQLAVQVLLATVVLSVPTDPRCPLEHKPDSAVLYEHNDNCNKFYMCLSNRTIVERNCPAGLQFDVDSSECIKSNESCDENRLIQKRVAVPQHIYCRPDRDGMLIPNRADGCRSFFKCSGGKPILTQCSSNLLFNEKTNYCDWEYNVQCGAQSIGNRPNSNYQLPSCEGADDGTTYANYQTQCKSYYFCNQGERRHVYCTDDLLFNPQLSTCDWRGNVNCTCRGICFGGPPDGPWDESFPDSDGEVDHLPPGIGGGAPDSDLDEFPDEFPELPPPPIERPPIGRPPANQPPARPRPPNDNQRPGPPDPDCVDCKPGQVDVPPTHIVEITPPPGCEHGCQPGMLDTTRRPPVTTPPPTTTCLNVPTTTTTTTRRTTTTTATTTTTTATTTTTTECPPVVCPDVKVPLCPPQPCPPENCIVQKCIPQLQLWNSPGVYTGPSVIFNAVKEAQRNNGKH